MFVIDFETRSTLNVKDVGSWIYARHPSTEPLCLAFSRVDDEGPPALWHYKLSDEATGYVMLPLFKAIQEGDFIEAHNVFFERCIWSLICVPRFGWPEIKPDQWRCTAARCSAIGLPRSLDAAAKVLGLPFLKDSKGKKTMMKLSKPRKPTKKEKATTCALFDGLENRPTLWHEKPEDLAALYDYCVQDVVVERAISKTVPELSPKELEIWKLDQTINLRGLQVDTEAVNGALALLGAEKLKADEACKELTGGEIQTLGQNRVIVSWLNQRGYGPKSIAQDVVEAWLKSTTLTDEAKRLLELYLTVAKSSTAKYQRFQQRTDDWDNRTRDLIVYCGAPRTGRWAGVGIQLQNMYRGTIKKDLIGLLVETIKAGDAGLLEILFGSIYEACASALRSMIIAAKGCRLIVCDFSAIEARVLAWLADETSALSIFADESRDIYKEFALDLYNLKSVDQVSKFQRQISKICILGLGYQMGANKYLATVEAYGSSISQDFADLCVQTFRRRFERYPIFWTRLERAAIAAVTTNKKYTVGNLKFFRRGASLRIELPSGRELVYIRPRVVSERTSWGEERPKLQYQGVSSKTRQWGYESTYGGKLAENVTQAVSRDLMAESMLELEARGYPNVLTVHDEAVLEVPYGFGSLAEVIEIMKEPPTWATGCPIGAAGFESERYRKD